MTYLLFGTALLLSATAAYYSIMGLIAIFAAAVIPIFIMGTLLEVSKLVVASWLYRSWKEIPKLMKAYFLSALVVLMLLTSMGIFGYLSKAHLDQAIPSGDIAAKLSLIDEKIKTEKENLNASRKELSQLDSQVDQTLSRTTDSIGADRAISIRKGQQRDRARILNEIGTAQTKIAKLNEERAPAASEVRKVEAEVGPIKYIAALIYGDTADYNLLESAVRIVILLIVFVFDPLAVLLLVAANWNLKHERGVPVKEETIEKPEPDNGVWGKIVSLIQTTPKEPVEEIPPKTASFLEKVEEIHKEVEQIQPEPVVPEPIEETPTVEDPTDPRYSNITDHIYKPSFGRPERFKE
jgi:hypothetical protein